MKKPIWGPIPATESRAGAAIAGYLVINITNCADVYSSFCPVLSTLN